MPSGWDPQPLRPPFRIMIVGCGTPRFFDASDEERAQIFLPRFGRMLQEWEELGARSVGSFCDDVFQVGETAAPFWAWYLVYEVDSLDVAAAMVQASRQTVAGIRLDRWIRIELRVGRPFFAREEAVPHSVVDTQAVA
jgi:hypothetical protein